MEEESAQYITGLRARGVCESSFMIKVEAMRILRLEAEQRNTELANSCKAKNKASNNKGKAAK